jgi:hypothetical protein
MMNVFGMVKLKYCNYLFALHLEVKDGYFQFFKSGRHSCWNILRGAATVDLQTIDLPLTIKIYWKSL